MLQPANPYVDFRFKGRPHVGGQPTRSGVVLLAVDEPSVGRMLMGVLARIGVANPIWMGTPDESLEWMRDTEEEVAVLLVDCHYSPEAGRDFCRWAWALRPGLEILMAGKAELGAGADVPADAGAIHHVPKPYLPTELAWQLRGLLCV